MTRLLAIDPGIRGCGVAVFEDGVLSDAAYLKNPNTSGGHTLEASTMAKEVVLWAKLGGTVEDLAVEWPQIYATAIRMGKSKADPNDLLPLTCVLGGVATCLQPAKAVSYKPREWKGNLPDEPTRTRTKSRLSGSELGVAEASARRIGALCHNMWDAVGIGLHHLGRFKPRRVIPT